MTAIAQLEKPRQLCFEHNHLTLQEYAIFCYIQRVSHSSGIFYRDGRKMESEFEGAKKNVFYRVIKSLEQKGWLLLIKSSSRSRNGTYSAAEYKPLSHLEWTKRYGRNNCKLMPAKSKTISMKKEGDSKEGVSVSEKTIAASQPKDVLQETALTVVQTNEMRGASHSVPGTSLKKQLPFKIQVPEDFDNYPHTMDSLREFAKRNNLTSASLIEFILRITKTSDRSFVSLTKQEWGNVFAQIDAAFAFI